MKKGVITLAIVVCGTLALSRPAAAQTDNGRCNDRLIEGTYGFTLVGDKLGGPGPVGPQVGVAMTTFDGAGNLTQTDSVVIGGSQVADFTHPRTTGSYVVTAACTGSFILEFHDGRPPTMVNFVIVDNGNEIDTVVVPPPGYWDPWHRGASGNAGSPTDERVAGPNRVKAFRGTAAVSMRRLDTGRSPVRCSKTRNDRAFSHYRRVLTSISLSIRTLQEVPLTMRILIGILMLCAAACTFGQTLPIKEGLWESTALNDDGTIAVRTLGCFTQKSFTEMTVKANSHPGCNVTQNVTSKGMVADVSCNKPEVHTSVHSVVELVDAQHMRGTVTMKMTYKGKTSDSTTKSTGRFVKSDCGNIKPGIPEITSE